MEYAPIGLTVYNRLHHLQKTVDCLKTNILARDSNLYIFSDGPRPGDEEKVLELRNYLRTIDGFKNIKIIERTGNSRVNNNRGGAKYLLDKYGKMIWLAEDVLCAPGFLTFANQALIKYKNEPSVNTISGYLEPITIPKSYHYDAFFSHRFNGWGFAIWKDRYFKLPARINRADFTKLINNRHSLKRFKYLIGEDAIEMVINDIDGKTDALDVRIMYYQFINNLLTVRPARSLTQNIGHDGTGLHCGVTTRFDVYPWGKKDTFSFPDKLTIDKKYASRISRFRRVNRFRIILNRILRNCIHYYNRIVKSV